MSNPVIPLLPCIMTSWFADVHLAKFVKIFIAHVAFCLVACGMDVVTSSVNGNQSVDNLDDWNIKVLLRNFIGSAVSICFEIKLYFSHCYRYIIITAINNSYIFGTYLSLLCRRWLWWHPCRVTCTLTSHPGVGIKRVESIQHLSCVIPRCYSLSLISATCVTTRAVSSSCDSSSAHIWVKSKSFASLSAKCAVFHTRQCYIISAGSWKTIHLELAYPPLNRKATHRLDHLQIHR